uniref:Uncharacterized protein n=1 Tax=Manihot esculenta TaxID=3983 RepID=A0A2C9UUL5_MANES
MVSSLFRAAVSCSPSVFGGSSLNKRKDVFAEQGKESMCLQWTSIKLLFFAKSVNIATELNKLLVENNFPSICSILACPRRKVYMF